MIYVYYKRARAVACNTIPPSIPAPKVFKTLALARAQMEPDFPNSNSRTREFLRQEQEACLKEEEAAEGWQARHYEELSWAESQDIRFSSYY